MTPSHDDNQHPKRHSSDPGARNGLLNEAMLCDLIEGHLSEEKAETARSILARDPQLSSTLAQIEHDRAVLQSLGDEMCPADMFNRLEPLLEREMLLEQEAHNTSTAELRAAPNVVVRQQRTWRIPAMVFATAAALVVVTGIVIFAQQFIASLPSLAPGSRVADSTQNPPMIDPAPIPDPAEALLPSPDENTQLALVDPARDATTGTPESPLLVDQPLKAIRLAKAGRARLSISGVSAEEAYKTFEDLNTFDAPWNFEGLDTAGPIFCMVDPVPQAWSALTFALRESGMNVSLDPLPPLSPEAVDFAPTLTPERVLWWKHRSTWSVPRARLPITIDE